MKKTIALSAILLLPVLVSAFELNNEQQDMLKGIENTIQATCEKETEEAITGSRRAKIRQVKKIIRNSKKPFEAVITWSSEPSSLVPSAFYRNKYYVIEKLEEQLEETNLKTFLENDPEALSEAADYVTDHIYSTFHNEFEALLTLGVTPIEAAIRTKHEDYIQSALERGEITYQHCYTEYFEKHEPAVSFGGYEPKTEDITITVTITQQEINDLKNRFPANKLKNPSSGLQEVFTGYSQIEKSGDY